MAEGSSDDVLCSDDIRRVETRPYTCRSGKTGDVDNSLEACHCTCHRLCIGNITEVFVHVKPARATLERRHLIAALE
jgi:hypothetical protein